MSDDLCILHLDMDAFFAAVEQRDDPSLRGKPVLIGHDGPRGVVATASYEARPFGCHSAQPMAIAKRRCPHAIILPGRPAHYRDISQQMFTILESISPAIEPLSIDEAFIGLEGTRRLLGDPVDVARGLRRRIAEDLQMTASVGVAPNKFLAKLASDMQKPDGLTVIREADIDRVLPPLPVTRIWGIGKAAASRLEPLGIRTIGDLRRMPMPRLEQYFGAEAHRFFNLARGIDKRPVITDREAKSIGHEQTFEVDLVDADAVRRVLFSQVEQVGGRLRRNGVRAQGLSLKVRFGDFETITRSYTFPESTDISREMWDAARHLFDQWAGQFQPVRLIGVTAERLTRAEGQMGLFPDAARDQQRGVDQLMDRINRKLGAESIRRAGGAG